MRLLLDAHLSPERVGQPLTDRGHDVVALASDVALGALDDPEVLRLAADEHRILVTRNARDFAPILREWAEAGREHAGCILIWTRAHHEFQAITEGVSRLLAERSDPEQWRNLTVAL